MKNLNVDEIKRMIKMSTNVEFVRRKNGEEELIFSFQIDSRIVTLTFDGYNDPESKIYHDETETIQFNIEDFNLAKLEVNKEDISKIIKRFI